MRSENPLDALDMEALLKPLSEAEIIARQKKIIQGLILDRSRLEDQNFQLRRRVQPDHAYRVAQIAAQVLTAGACLTPDGALDLARYLIENALPLESK